jgi:hypothetical protein
MAGRYSRWFVSRSAFFARLRAFMLGFHLVFSIAALTFCFVASFTLPVSFTTCETVAIETAAAFATSLMVTRPDPRTLRIFAITFSESVSRHASPTSPSCGVLIPRFVSFGIVPLEFVELQHAWITAWPNQRTVTSLQWALDLCLRRIVSLGFPLDRSQATHPRTRFGSTKRLKNLGRGLHFILLCLAVGLHAEPLFQRGNVGVCLTARTVRNFRDIGIRRP